MINVWMGALELTVHQFLRLCFIILVKKKNSFCWVQGSFFKRLIHHQAHLANLKPPGLRWSHCVVRTSRSSHSLMVLYWYIYLLGHYTRWLTEVQTPHWCFSSVLWWILRRSPRKCAQHFITHSPFDTVTQLDHTNVLCPNMMDLQQRSRRL